MFQMRFRLGKHHMAGYPAASGDISFVMVSHRDLDSQRLFHLIYIFIMYNK